MSTGHDNADCTCLECILARVMSEDASVIFQRAYPSGTFDVTFAFRGRDGRCSVQANGETPRAAMKAALVKLHEEAAKRHQRALLHSRRHSNRFADSYADPLAWRGTPPYT